MNQLLQLVDQATQNVAVIGDRRVGKTSLLNFVMAKLDAKRYLTAYVDLSRIRRVPNEDREQRLKRLLWLIVVQLCASYADAQGQGSLAMKVRETLRTITFRKAERPLDFRIFKIPVEVQKDVAKLTERAFSLPEELANRARRRFVLILDEFQFLADFGMEFLWTVRSIKSKQKAVTYVVSGSRHSFMQDLFTSNSSPFFGFFFTLTIENFSADQTSAYVRALCTSSYFRISDDGAKSVYDLTRGNPTYINWLLMQLFIRGLEEGNRRISEQSVRTVFSEGISSLTMLMQPEWNALSTNEQAITRVIAIHDHRSTRTIAQALGVPQSRVTPFLKSMIDKEVLRREKRGTVTPVDPIFFQWVRTAQRV